MAHRPFDVVVVGSINVDLTLQLPALPRPGQTVTGGSLVRSVGGKGANQALAAARLGARTAFVGLVGDDADGRLARAVLAGAGVDVQGLGLDPDQPTGLATVLTDQAGQNLIGVASGANASLTGTSVTAALTGLGAGVPVVVANLEIPDEAVLAAAVRTHENGGQFVLNPAPARPLSAEVLSRVRVLTPNEHEAAGLDFHGDLIVTRGAAGLDLIENGLAPQRIPAFAVPVVDSTGAGDACTGALAWALAGGAELARAAVLAAAAGALATRGVGAQASLPTAAELFELVERGQRL